MLCLEYKDNFEVEKHFCFWLFLPEVVACSPQAARNTFSKTDCVLKAEKCFHVIISGLRFLPGFVEPNQMLFRFPVNHS